MRVREATPGDGPGLVQLFLDTPLRAGTTLVLDRAPDFFASSKPLLASKTFLIDGARAPEGVVTVRWRRAADGSRSVTVGEVADFRIAPHLRGTRAAYELLKCAWTALRAAGTDWVTCLIADRNEAASALVRGAAPLPSLLPLDRWASMHYVAWRVPRFLFPNRVAVRRAHAADLPVLHRLRERSTGSWRLRASDPEPLQDENTYHAWVADDSTGLPVGALVVRDDISNRRIRVMRYSASDQFVRAAAALANAAGAGAALPRPGGVLRIWASCWIGAADGNPAVIRALVYTAIRAAARAAVPVVQINVSQRDAVHRALPRSLASAFWSTLYGRALQSQSSPVSVNEICHADVAHV